MRRAKPHIGTDKLRGVVKNIRREIERLGGEIKFGVQVEGLAGLSRKAGGPDCRWAADCLRSVGFSRGAQRTGYL